MDTILQGVFDTTFVNVIEISDFILCIAVSLFLGFVLALSYMYKSRYTKSFVVTLAILPAIVCVVIMMVNGNVGTGVAVAGAFSLVRFRSVAGSAKEIGMIFMAMGTGLITGMGYLAYAAIFTIVMSVVFMVYNHLDFGAKKNAEKYKILKIMVPEDLNYVGVFDSIFAQYTHSYELVKVKSTNLGSMFKLTYHIVLKDSLKEKELIDAIRCRNANLEIMISRQESVNAEL